MGMMNELTQVAMSDMMPCQGTRSVIFTSSVHAGQRTLTATDEA
jgi:hypothetical protein